LNLLYPDALAKLRVTVHDVKQLHGQLKSADPNGENGAIARNTLLDTVDSSGINLEALESLLTQISERIDGSNGRRASCFLTRLMKFNAMQQPTCGGVSLHAVPCQRFTLFFGESRRWCPNRMP
jgi:hypothetical protein